MAGNSVWDGIRRKEHEEWLSTMQIDKGDGFVGEHEDELWGRISEGFVFYSGGRRCVADHLARSDDDNEVDDECEAWPWWV